MYLRNPFILMLYGIIGLILGFWVGYSFATSPGTITQRTEANRQAAVPGLYFLTDATVVKCQHFSEKNVIEDAAKNFYGYVGLDFAPLGTRVKVFEIQPGGRRYFYRVGIDYEPRPYPPEFDPVP